MMFTRRQEPLAAGCAVVLMTKHVKSPDTTPGTEGGGGAFIGRVVIVEDQRLFAEFLQYHCRDLRLEVMPLAAGYQAGLTAIRTHKPDLVLLDISLPDGDGLELARLIIHELPRIKLLAISAHHDPWTMLQVQRIGIHGFVDKNDHNSGQLAAAIRGVMAGERYFSPRALSAWTGLRNDPAAFDKILSAREQHLLRLFGQGSSNEEIAQAINLCELTVRNHRCRIMAKLGLKTSAELITYAYAKGFVRAQPNRALSG